MEALLAQLARSVTGATDLESLTRPLLELLESVTGLESTYLTSIDERRGLQHILFSRNTRQVNIPEGLSVPWGDTLCKRALEENKPFTDDVAGCWGDSDAARELGIKTYLSQPVRTVDGGLFGTLCAASATSRPISPDALKVLGLFATLIARQLEREQVVENLKSANAQLSNHALVDPLTGVANRRALMLELDRSVERARREGAALHVAFIDLDGFKAINDRYGHEIGDRFLADVGRRLANGVRAADFVARYGGDEFVVVAFNTSPDELRSRLEKLIIGGYGYGDIFIDYPGASVGVVASSLDDASPNALIARADAAMYTAKNARRQARH